VTSDLAEAGSPKPEAEAGSLKPEAELSYNCAVRLAVFGDSVLWGQGLRPEHKLTTIVADARQMTVDLLAHSGATIGVDDDDEDEPVDGEVPVPRPTVLQQVDAYMPTTSEVGMVLVNGGLNDIDFRVILNPFTSLNDLHRKTVRFCYRDMLTLLDNITQRFFGQDLPIVVTGYYPIVSPKTDPVKTPRVLAAYGVSFSPLAGSATVFDKIVALSMQFWQDSTEQLMNAVHDCGDSRVTYADVPFTEDHAVFTADPWLFGLKSDLFAFGPQDEVIDERHDACNIVFDDFFHLLDREGCYRASAGHPNVAGAQQYAEAILAAV